MSSRNLAARVFSAGLLVAAAGVARAGDVEPLQIQIEARVVEAADDFARDLGVRFGAFGGGDAALGTAEPTGEPWVGMRPSFAPFPLGDDARVLSEPSVTTRDAASASLAIDQPAVIELLLTPRVLDDGTLRLQLELALPGGAPGASPAVETRRVRTTVRVPDGGSLAIGGLQTADDDGDGRVPWLGKVPLVGRLFRSDAREAEQRRLLIFLTPRLVGELGSGRPRWSTPPGRPDGASRERIYRPRIDPNQ